MEYQCTVTESKPLSPNVFSLKFIPDRPLAFQAGQYISVVVPQEGKPLRRPYSIASAPGISPIELCIQTIEQGPGSNYLHGLKVGDVFSGFAPYGFLLYQPKPNRDVYFVSTGTGIAPFRSMVFSDAYHKHSPRKATCLLGVKTEKEILYGEDFSRVKNMRWVPCLSRETQVKPDRFQGRVTQFLHREESAIVWPETDFYLCGNGAMIDEVKAFLRARGVEKGSIFQEIYFKPPKSA